MPKKGVQKLSTPKFQKKKKKCKKRVHESLGNLKKVVILEIFYKMPLSHGPKKGHFWSFLSKKKVKKVQKTGYFGSLVKKIHYSHSFYKRLNFKCWGCAISRAQKGSMGPRRSSIGAKKFQFFFRFIRLK